MFRELKKRKSALEKLEDDIGVYEIPAVNYWCFTPLVPANFGLSAQGELYYRPSWGWSSYQCELKKRRKFWWGRSRGWC